MNPSRHSSIFRHQIFSLLSCTAVFVGTPQARAEMLFDNVTGATLNFSPNIPHTYMGGMFNLNLPPESTGALISSIEVSIISLTAQAYTNIQLNVQLWNTVLATGGATPAFGDPVGGVQTQDEGPFTFPAINLAATATFTFSSPLLLTGSGPHGITVNWKGDTGSGLQDTTNLTTLLRVTAPYAVGSSSVNGYFRNASGLTTMNFLGSDLRILSSPNNTNNNLAFKLVGTPVPEPSTWAMLAGLGALALAVVWRRRVRTVSSA